MGCKSPPPRRRPPVFASSLSELPPGWPRLKREPPRLLQASCQWGVDVAITTGGGGIQEAPVALEWANIFFRSAAFPFSITLYEQHKAGGLSELLSQATINLDLKSTDRDSVLAELVNQIPQLADQPEARQTLLRALHEREQLHSTGIGDGIALPHSRNALVGLVDQPIMVFGRHKKGFRMTPLTAYPRGCSFC